MAGTRRLTELGGSVVARARVRLPEGPAVVALSGGADSAVCAWAAREVGAAQVRAVHVHHGFTASDALAAAASAIADKLGIDCDVVTVEVREGPSPEGQARAVRHRALEEAAGPGEWLLTGHTRDDQAETVVGNLLRGAGAAGLRGITDRGRWVRPLLDVTRAETRELAALAGLPFRDDPANVTDYRRNIIRRDVLPRLESAFNPRLRETLARTAGRLAEDEAVLDGAAALVPSRPAGAGLALPAALLATLPRAVAARAARAALRRCRPPYGGSAEEIAVILEVAAGERRRTALAGGMEATREGPWVVIGAGGATPGAEVALSLPGTAACGSVLVSAWVEERPPQPWPLGTATVVLDADVLGMDAVLRPAEPGERVEITAGSKAVSDALAEAGVPERLRAGWPVVAARGKLAWVVGARAAAWAAPTPGTGRYLWLTYEMENA